MTDQSDSELPFELEPNEDVIERVVEGEPSLLLWVQTCPTDDCPCRVALVVVAQDRQELGDKVAIVREAWDEAEDAAAFAKALQSAPIKEIVAFEIDIDSGDIGIPLAEERETTSEVAKYAELVDGQLLDRLASLWYLGKDQEDASQIAIEPGQIKDFRPGQLLAWDEVYEGARMDVYRDGAGEDVVEVEAIDTYCVRPKCECNEVRVQFYEIGEEEEGHLGSVAVKLEEPVTVAYHGDESRRALLETFWAKFQKRHPDWVTRLAGRAELMQQFGEKLNRKSSTQPKKPWVSSSRKRQGKPKK